MSSSALSGFVDESEQAVSNSSVLHLELEKPILEL